MLYFSHMYILETHDLTCFNNNGKKELLDCEIKMLYLFSKKEKENNNNNKKNHIISAIWGPNVDYNILHI